MCKRIENLEKDDGCRSGLWRQGEIGYDSSVDLITDFFLNAA